MSQFEDLEFNPATPSNVVSMEEAINREMQAEFTLVIQTDVFKQSVEKIARAISSNSPLESLRNLHMVVQANDILLQGGNSLFSTETHITDIEAFRVEGRGGSIMLPGKQFAEIMKRLSGKSTTLTVKSNQAMIKSGGAKMKLALISGDYPDQYIQSEEVKAEQKTITLSPDILSRMYDKTLYAVSASEQRPILTGICHQLSGKTFSCIATDSHRLSKQIYELDQEFEDFQLVIHGMSIAEIRKYLVDTKSVTIHFNDRYATFVFDHYTLHTKILNGTYPDVERIIPKAAKTEVVLNVRQLKELMSRASLADTDKPLEILILADAKQVRLQSKSDTFDFQEDILPIQAHGDNVRLGFAMKYMIDLLKAKGPEDRLKIGFTGEMSPFTIHLFNGDSENVELILPVRVHGAGKEVEIKDFNPPEYDVDPLAEELAGLSESA